MLFYLEMGLKEIGQAKRKRHLPETACWKKSFFAPPIETLSGTCTSSFTVLSKRTRLSKGGLAQFVFARGSKSL